MYKHILIATDGSELAEKAVTTGLSLAKALGARATAVTVTEPWTAFVTGEAIIAFPFDEYEKSAADRAAKILASVSSAATQLDTACATVHIKEQYPAEGILQTAKDSGCDLIVMASHGRRGLARLLLGSQALRVLTYSTVPVLICR
jgi:nucleotide-binding universal stress UspA family protein